MMACPLDTTNFFLHATKSHFPPIKAPLLCNLHKPAIAYVTLQFLPNWWKWVLCSVAKSSKLLTGWVTLEAPELEFIINCNQAKNDEENICSWFKQNVGYLYVALVWFVEENYPRFMIMLVD